MYISQSRFVHPPIARVRPAAPTPRMASLGRFGQAWIDVSLLVDEFFEALTALFDILDVSLPGFSLTFLDFFNIL